MTDNKDLIVGFDKRSSIYMILALMLLMLGISMLTYRMGWNDAVKAYNMGEEVDER